MGEQCRDDFFFHMNIKKLNFYKSVLKYQIARKAESFLEADLNYVITSVLKSYHRGRRGHIGTGGGGGSVIYILGIYRKQSLYIFFFKNLLARNVDSCMKASLSRVDASLLIS